MRKLFWIVGFIGLLHSPCFSQIAGALSRQTASGAVSSVSKEFLVPRTLRYAPLDSVIRTPYIFNPVVFQEVWINPPAAPFGKKPVISSLPPLYPEIKTKFAVYSHIRKESRLLSLLTKAKTDAVIFDLDGTLLDSLPAWEHSGSNYVRSRGIEPEEGLDSVLEKMSLLDGANLLKAKYHFEETPEEILAATLAPIKQRYYTDIPAKAKVPQLLAFLKRSGIKMAVATASDADLARAALKRLGLLDYFEFIITCDEVGIGKTDPRVYEEALCRLGTRKDRTLVAEDALHALQTAQKAGFKTLGVFEKKAAAQKEQVQQFSTLFLNFD